MPYYKRRTNTKRYKKTANGQRYRVRQVQAAQYTPETKFIDGFLSNIAVTNDTLWCPGSFTIPASQGDAGNMIVINPAAGTKAWERVGRRIFVKRIEIKLAFTLSPTLVTSRGDTLIVQLFHDNQTKGAVATLSNVYEGGATNVAAGTQGYMAPRTNDFKGRFKLLRQCVVDFSLTSSSTANMIDCCSWIVPVNKTITYSGTTGGGIVTEVQDHSWFILACCINGDGTTTIPVRVYARWRAFYTDV